MDVYSKYSLLLRVRPEILRRHGLPFVAVAWASLAHPSAPRRVWEVYGRMLYGRICLRGAESNYSFKARAPIPDFSNSAMDSRVEFITDSLKMIDSPTNRFPPGYNGAWILPPPLGGFPLARWFSDLTRLICLVGETETKICCLRRTRPPRVNLHRNGSYACGRRKRPAWK